MLNKSAGSIQTPSSRFQLWSKPHHLILTIMWLLTTAVMVTMLWLGVRETGRYGEVRTILQAGYVAALIWYLIRSGPSLNQLPALQPLLFPRRRYGAWIPVLGIALLLALTATSDAGLALFFIVTSAGTIGILIAWRRQLRLRSRCPGSQPHIDHLLSSAYHVQERRHQQRNFRFFPGSCNAYVRCRRAAG